MAEYKTFNGPEGPVRFPSSMSDDEIRAVMRKKYPPKSAQVDPVSASSAPRRGSATQALRMAELGSRGFLGSLGETVGAIPEVAAWGMRQVGLPAPPSGYYQGKIREMGSNVGGLLSAPLNAVAGDGAGPMVPETGAERFAYGAGRGAGDAVSFMAPGMALAKTARAGSLAQNTGRALASQPVLQTVAGATAGGTAEQTGSQLAGLAAGLATAVAPSAAMRMVSPVSSQLSANQQRLAQRARDAGIELTAGQQTGSPTLQNIEQGFAKLWGSSGSQRAIYDNQRKAFNKAVLQQAGVRADEASPEVLARAFRDIGNEFDDLARATTLRPDQEFIQDVASVAANNARRLSADQKPILQSYVDDFMDMHRANMRPGANVQIEGREYQRLSSDIKKRARTASDSELSRSLNELASSLDDALERSAGPDLVGAWRDVRGRYKNLLTIDMAMRAGTQADRSSADIPFSGLKSAVQRMDTSGYARGRGDLNDLSRVGDFMGAQRQPDPGTANAMMARSGILGIGGLGGASVAGGIDPFIAIPAAVGVAAAPRAAQLMYNSPLMQAYLRNQAMMGPTREAAQILGKVGMAQQLGEAKQPGILRTK
jgi:hypothetical protein